MSSDKIPTITPSVRQHARDGASLAGARDGASLAGARDGASLAGATAWVITDGKAGSESQAIGIATALGLDYTLKRVDPRGIFRLIAPFGPVEPRERFGKEGARFSAPYPDVAISIGRRSAPYLRAVKRAHAGCFTVQLLDSRAGTGIADVIWVPEHDRLRGANVITTLAAPHPFSPARLAALRQAMPPRIAALPAPRIAVLLGGRNPANTWPDGDHARLSAALAAFAAAGASFLVTGSRRTHAELLAAARDGTEGAPRIIHDGAGENPYPHFLACSDVIVVTGDSVSMTAEAAATGRPVHVFHPTGVSGKFRRYHDALEAAGITRRLTQESAQLTPWSYEPVDATRAIAAEIERRWRDVQR